MFYQGKKTKKVNPIKKKENLQRIDAFLTILHKSHERTKEIKNALGILQQALQNKKHCSKFTLEAPFSKNQRLHQTNNNQRPKKKKKKRMNQ